MAEFRFDQATPGSGVPGRTRHDLVPGEVITLVATDPLGPGVTYAWEILDKVGSVAVLSSATGQTVEIGPAGDIVRPCSFRVRLTVNNNGVVTTMIRRASVRTAVTGMFVPLFPESAPTAGTLASNTPDSSEDNAVYTNRAGLGVADQNWRGWAEWAYELVLAVESGGGAGGPPTGPASGDLGGTYPSPDVVRLRGRAIENVAPSDNNYLRWDSGTSSWRPTAFPTVLPPTGAAGGDLADNYPNPTVAGLRGFAVQSGTPTLNDILRFDGTDWKRIYHGSFIDGSAAQPSITFGSDPGTGLYHVAGDTLGAATAGTLRLAVSTTGIDATLPFRAVDGSAANPGYEFVSDQTSGVFLDGVIGSKAVGVSANGVEVVRAQAPGGAAPQLLLQSGSATTPSASFSSDPDTGLFSAGADLLGFVSGGTQRMYLSAAALNVTVNVAPTISGTYDVGHSARSFKDGYINRVLTGNGSVALPAIVSGLDLDTGIYFTTSAVHTSIAGTSRFHVHSQGIRVSQAASSVFPSIANLSETTTGIGLHAGAVGTIVGGAEILRVTSSQALIVDGTVALPSIAFAAGAGTGLYRAGANSLGIAAGATARMIINTTNTRSSNDFLPMTDLGFDLGAPTFRWDQVYANSFVSAAASTFADGTVSAPGVAFTNELSSGIWRDPATPAVAISASGTEVARFQAPSGANPQLVLPVGAATKPSLKFGTAESGLYSASNQIFTAYGGIGVWAFGPNTLYGQRASTNHIISVQGSGGWLTLGGRQALTTSANPSVTIDQYASLPFIGANVSQTLLSLVATVNQTGTSSFTALNIDVTETAAGSGAQYLIDTKIGGTQKFAVSTQGVRVTDGSTTSPSISGLTDGNSGLSFTTNAIRFLIGGSRGAELTSTGLSLREAGSAGTPAVRNLTHSQTGLFWPSVSELAITTQGTEVARFMSILNDATGDETILSIQGTVNKATSGNYTGIKLNVTDTLSPGSSDRLIDCQVGGVSQFIVDAAGTIFVDSGTASGPGVRFTADGNTGYFWASSDTTGISGGGLEIVRFSAVGGATPQILGAASSATAPVYSFGADSNTGMYRNAENVLGFATSGVDRLLISTTVMQPAVVINGISGSAGSPPFSFSADPDTGMFRAGADNIGWSVGGNQRLGLTNTALLPSGTVNLGSNSLAFDEVWHNETYLIDTTNAELSDTTVVGNVTTSAGTTTTVKVVGLKANRAMILEVRCVAIKNGGASDSYAEHCAVRAVADGVGAVTLQSATGTKIYQNRAGTIVKSEIQFSAPNPFEVNVDAYNDIADPGLKWSLTITWRQVSA